MKAIHRNWITSTAGVKVYMEGFRVLPYGERGDDWLELDFDYSQRSRTLRFLDSAESITTEFGEDDKDAALVALRNSSYFGAVFLTQRGAPGLEMLVNREGFIPNAEFISVQRIVRVGIDLSVRVRAFEGRPQRALRRQQRHSQAAGEAQSTPARLKMRQAAEESAKKAAALAQEARSEAAAGKTARAHRLIITASEEIKRSSGFTNELMADRSIMQILAGVGLQMSAFVHEMNGLLGMVSAVEASVASLRKRLQLDREAGRNLAKIQQNVSDLRRVVERQASYLTDITSPDARRRRSRQKLAERFEATTRLVRRAAERRGIAIDNRIPGELKSPPMFPAELMVIYSNLLTNAIKACRSNGRVCASGRQYNDGSTSVRIDNTGRRMSLRDAEKWFLAFKSTTVEADPVLGQGMGMGLPIVRNILEEYGATVCFTKPRAGFATALEITFG